MKYFREGTNLGPLVLNFFFLMVVLKWDWHGGIHLKELGPWKEIVGDAHLRGLIFSPSSTAMLVNGTIPLL